MLQGAGIVARPGPGLLSYCNWQETRRVSTTCIVVLWTSRLTGRWFFMGDMLETNGQKVQMRIARSVEFDLRP
ncbi:hypothetical protein HBI04_152670 [Parastagonospora nodorum]|nr:hypothetical protein HBI03_157670 [Parastagonospora nodorum]KAH4269888.1 hypothetical protein HBI04_152670 [Parastagonospora nodorum]